MALYARPSWQLTRQITTDVFVVVWTGAWWFAGRALDASGWERYLEIFRQDGELAALRWLKDRPAAEGGR